MFRLLLIVAAALLHQSFGLANEPRIAKPITDAWEFRRDDSQDWKTIQLPASFEEHEGEDFNGIGWYRRTLSKPDLTTGQRAVLWFQAVATETEVRCNGVVVGKHLGGWTPFGCDITEQIRSPQSDDTVEILVRVDERVGHNSQGFLPVFAPHFGGAWQDITLRIVSDVRIDETRVMAIGDIHMGRLKLEIPITAIASPRNQPSHATISVRQRGSTEVVAKKSILLDDAVRTTLAEGKEHRVETEIQVPDHQLWNPQSPVLYDVEIELAGGLGAEGTQDDEHVIDRVRCTAAFREIKVDGDALVLNGKQIQLRGVLNWGYAPPRTAPSIDPTFWKQEIELVRSYGFNTMKFCLWIPPQGYLDMADEMGMLTWVEYPTWHSRWNADQLPILEREFGEFFAYDRNHPSVVLRSLTCETGPSADLNVIRSLYDKCHAMIPGSVVEDDSSWIEWNRVHDFYDDHPYGNNHTWVRTLDRLKKHIQTNGVQPLVLGEAIAADTWANPHKLLEGLGEARPFWLPNFADANQTWLAARNEDMGTASTQSIETDSLKYALAMRKFQIETYRREVPKGNYVVSVIRDFPFAGMGLMDFQGKPKWNAGDWSWHGDDCLILQTENDRKSFSRDQSISASVLLSHFGPSIDGLLQINIADAATGTIVYSQSRPLGKTSNNGVQLLTKVDVPANKVMSATEEAPKQLTITVRVDGNDNRKLSSQWSIWGFPNAKEQAPVYVHPSMPLEKAQSLFPNVKEWTKQAQSNTSVILASRIDAELMERMIAGNKVFMIPDGERGSLPTKDHWFLRGAPIVGELPSSGIPRTMLMELQHFDLAGPVVPDIQWLDEMKPMLMLWDNHDIDHVKTHGLVFSSKIGNGQLLVSSLNHFGKTNSAGKFLAHSLTDSLLKGDIDARAMTPETIDAIRGKLTQQTIDLTERPWTFRVDTDNQGVQANWHMPNILEAAAWKPMQIGKHWEGLGYPALDGWAWYRIEVELPKSWSGQPVYVCFDGADDYYELYANGHLSGSGGDIANKKTAFEERKCHAVTEWIEPGKPLSLAVRVYDWYGAGGLFRPIILSTTPRNPAGEIIR